MRQNRVLMLSQDIGQPVGFPAKPLTPAPTFMDSNREYVHGWAIFAGVKSPQKLSSRILEQSLLLSHSVGYPL